MTFPEFIKNWNNQEDYIKTCTSGSTGEPKEIKISKEFMKESAKRTNNFFNIQSSSLLHSCISPDFIGGKMMAVRALVAGSNFTWEQPSNTPLKDITKEIILDLVSVVPPQLHFILENLVNLPRIKNILAGGAPINDKLREKIVETNLNVYETFGMTETASHIALRKVSKQNEPFLALNGISVDKDEDSCLIIKMPYGKIFHTNDIAKIISDNEFFILGRKDFIINSGGKKLNPFETEKKISRFINSNFCMAGFPDDKWGQKIVLIIENSPHESKINELWKNLEHILERWQLPKEIIFVRSLPQTGSGKIKRPRDYNDLYCVVPDNNLGVSVRNKQEQ